MNFGSPEMPPKQEDYTRFYEADPYKVLGVSRGANAEDIKKARMKLQIKFHPDRNKDPRAEEISKKINIAYDLLHEPNGIFVENPAQQETHQKQSESAKPKKESKNTTEKETIEGTEDEFFIILAYGSATFTDWLIKAKKNGISLERIKEMLRTAQSKQILKENLTSELRYSGGNAGKCLVYIQRWSDTGIEMSGYLEECLSTFVFDDMNGPLGKFNISYPEKFVKFTEDWRNAGIDLNKITESSDAHKTLLEFLLNDINGPLGKFNISYPEKFAKLAESWTRAGIDLSKILESQEAQNALTEYAMEKIKYSSYSFKPFVQEWMAAGWKPNQEIMKLYNS